MGAISDLCEALSKLSGIAAENVSRSCSSVSWPLNMAKSLYGPLEFLSNFHFWTVVVIGQPLFIGPHKCDHCLSWFFMASGLDLDPI